MSAAAADLTALAQDLAMAGSSMEQAAHKVVEDTATQVRDLAVSIAPRKTGKLADSIVVSWQGTNVAIIGPTVEYGTYQEFGTGTRGEFPGKAYEITPKTGKALVFKLNGKTVFARKVVSQGVKAQPYMRPALAQALGPMADQLAEAGALQIVKGPNG